MKTTDTLTALVVDDSEVICTLVTKILTKLGFHVEIANDGFEVLGTLATSSPDVIFMDITMPRVNGYQTCQLIKNNSDHKHTPLIFLTSSDGLFEMAKGRWVGCDGYLTKPFTQKAFIELINTLEISHHDLLI